MAKFEKSFQEFLDGLSDEELVGYLMLGWTQTIPIFKPCSKEEYEKNNPEYDLSTNEGLIKMLENITKMGEYRRVPYWRNGGGIMDQILCREPDGYTYEKKVGEKKCILVGSAMMEYINKRELTKKFKFLNL